MTPEKRKALAAACAAKKPSPEAIAVAEPPKPAEQPPKAPKAQKKRKRVEIGRLPDKSSYSATYDAAKTLWHMTLYIPASNQKFEAFGSSLHKTFDYLADKYRQSLPENTVDVTQKAG